METRQVSRKHGDFRVFKGKIVGQDSLRWNIDLSGDSEPEIFAVKEKQKLEVQFNDSVFGDYFNDHYIIRNKK